MKPERPTVKLLGTDGNAFAVLGACKKAAKKAGWGQPKIDAWFSEATKGDYEYLLRKVSEYFEVS